MILRVATGRGNKKEKWLSVFFCDRKQKARSIPKALCYSKQYTGKVYTRLLFKRDSIPETKRSEFRGFLFSGHPVYNTFPWRRGCNCDFYLCIPFCYTDSFFPYYLLVLSEAGFESPRNLGSPL